jgi:hypothetical protein
VLTVTAGLLVFLANFSVIRVLALCAIGGLILSAA